MNDDRYTTETLEAAIEQMLTNGSPRTIVGLKNNCFVCPVAKAAATLPDVRSCYTSFRFTKVLTAGGVYACIEHNDRIERFIHLVDNTNTRRAGYVKAGITRSRCAKIWKESANEPVAA